jgi:hypothetical protein
MKARVGNLLQLMAGMTCLGLTCCANAADVMLDFSGTITRITYGQFGSQYDPDYSVGDAYTATLLYSSTLMGPGLWPSDPSMVSYLGGSQDAYIRLNVTLGALTYHAGESLIKIQEIRVKDSPAGDFFQAQSEGPAASRYLIIALFDSTGSALNGTGLPTSLDIADWDGGSFQIQQPWGTVLDGNITGLPFVPEPSTFTLSLAGLGAAALTASRRLKLKRSGR